MKLTLTPLTLGLRASLATAHGILSVREGFRVEIADGEGAGQGEAMAEAHVSQELGGPDGVGL